MDQSVTKLSLVPAEPESQQTIFKELDVPSSVSEDYARLTQAYRAGEIGWRQATLCGVLAGAGAINPEIFYPDQGGVKKLARDICAECVVLVPCLSEVMPKDSPNNGFRGGKSYAERRKLGRLAAKEFGTQPN